MYDTPSQRPRHPMRVVMQRTGLSADVLRAWERRYGVVHPDRSDGGQRLYSDADVTRLALLKRATARGHAISQLVDLPIDDLAALVAADEAAAEPPRAEASVALHAEANQAVDRLDPTELEAVLRRAVIQLGSAIAVDEVIIPLLRDFGDRWHRGEITPAHEHMGTVAIRRVLAWVSASAPVSPDAPLVVVATPSNQRHELGAKLAATTAATEGWRVLFLGADLPADAIAGAATQSGARLVALSLLFPERCPKLLGEVTTLRALLPSSVELVAGGPAALANQRDLAAAGVQVLTDLGDLRQRFRDLAARH